MTTQVKFTLTGNSNNLYLQLEDIGFDIEDTFPENDKLQVVIPFNNNQYIVSKSPMISLKSDNKNTSEFIKNIFESNLYENEGIYHTYQIDNNIYHFFIYYKALDFIIENALFNNTLKHTFLDNNLYIRISSKFKGNTITDYLNKDELELPEYYCRINKKYQYNKSNKDVIIDNYQRNYSLSDEISSLLDRIFTNTLYDTDYIKIEQLITEIDNFDFEFTIKYGDGVIYDRKDLQKILSESLNINISK